MLLFAVCLIEGLQQDHKQESRGIKKVKCISMNSYNYGLEVKQLLQFLLLRSTNLNLWPEILKGQITCCFSAPVTALEESFASNMYRRLKPGILPHFLLSSFSSSVKPGKVQDKISARGLFTYPISHCEAKQLAWFSSAIAS